LQFSSILTCVCVLGQHDYYRIAVSQGHLPASRTGIITTVLMMFSLLFASTYAEAVVPICATLICCYLLFRTKPRIATIADLSTSLAGLFYAGLLPSFYVRLHMLKYLPSTRLGQWMASAAYVPTFGTQPTTGALTIFVSFLVESISDRVRSFLLRITRGTAWSTALCTIVGFVTSVGLSILGAYLLSWPKWRLLGFIYGIILALCGLIGRLTAPMFERTDEDQDAAVVSYRSIFKVTDSYVFLAPLAYYFIVFAVPLALNN